MPVTLNTIQWLQLVRNSPSDDNDACTIGRDAILFTRYWKCLATFFSTQCPNKSCHWFFRCNFYKTDRFS